jgi:hypothetical protein
VKGEIGRDTETRTDRQTDGQTDRHTIFIKEKENESIPLKQLLALLQLMQYCCSRARTRVSPGQGGRGRLKGHR